MEGFLSRLWILHLKKKKASVLKERMKRIRYLLICNDCDSFTRHHKPNIKNQASFSFFKIYSKILYDKK